MNDEIGSFCLLLHRVTGSERSSSSSSVWDTTNKVLGVNTVLGTAGLASASITLPSLGGGVVGGAATAALGVATAASLVTGVGVIAGMGVAGVQYVRKQSQRGKRRGGRGRKARAAARRSSALNEEETVAVAAEGEPAKTKDKEDGEVRVATHYFLGD